MTFFGMTLRNLVRQRVRSLLTLTGIAIAIATVVALGAITGGMRATATGFVRSGGAAFMVAQEGAADLTFSTLPESVVPRIERIEGVAQARGVFLHITSGGSNPYFFLAGVDPTTMDRDRIQLTDGRLVSPGVRGRDEIVLGDKAARDLGVGIGDRVTVAKHRFRLVGIFTSDVLWESGGGYAALGTVQKVAGKPGKLTITYVDLDPNADPSAVAASIEKTVPGVVVISGAADYSKVDQGFVILDAANAAISALAVLIGGIGVMNTMVMSVFERTREIGVLRAVGWSGRRVLRMVLTESLVLCIVAACLGVVFGVLAARLVVRAPAVKGFIELSYGTDIFIRGFVVALVVGIAGALYPAIRAARMTPMEALRYE